MNATAFGHAIMWSHDSRSDDAMTDILFAIITVITHVYLLSDTPGYPGQTDSIIMWCMFYICSI